MAEMVINCLVDNFHLANRPFDAQRIWGAHFRVLTM